MKQGDIPNSESAAGYSRDERTRKGDPSPNREPTLLLCPAPQEPSSPLMPRAPLSPHVGQGSSALKVVSEVWPITRRFAGVGVWGNAVETHFVAPAKTKENLWALVQSPRPGVSIPMAVCVTRPGSRAFLWVLSEIITHLQPWPEHINSPSPNTRTPRHHLMLRVLKRF